MKIEDIWLEYRSALKKFLHVKVSNEADVDDLLQEILIKTHNSLATVKNQASVKAWLFQIANHTIIDHYRQQGRSQVDITVPSWPAPTEQNDIDLSQCILPFINALPASDASLLTAIDINNQSQKQYAEQIGVSYSTLKSRVQKSRSLLKKVFDDCCHFSIDKNGSVYDYELKAKLKTQLKIKGGNTKV